MIGLSDVAVINRQTYSRVVCERRFMYAAVTATTIGMIMFILAVSISEWVTIDFTIPSVAVGIVNETKIIYRRGIWGEWEITKKTNGDISNYYRTQAVFACISMCLMLSANGCAVYSLRVHRYMYKRLAAGLYFVTALCLIICIEVMVHSVDSDQRKRKDTLRRAKHPDQTGIANERIVRYSYSTAISWFTFALYLVAVAIFIIGSRKRKGSRAATQEFEIEDRPVELGRV